MDTQKESFHTTTGESSASRKTYVVTLDLPGKMQAFVKNGLKIPEGSFFHKMQANLLRELQEIMPQYEVQAIKCADLYNKIIEFIHELTANRNEILVVSSVPELVEEVGGVHLQINRIVDCHGKLLGVGPRPGYSPLNKQFEEIAIHAAQWPLLLAEDGSFTGGTIFTVLKLCRSHGIKFKFLVIGLLFSEASETIAKLNGQLKVRAVHEWEKNDFIDWLPDYDFFPFIPNSGRIVGHNYNGIILPIYLHNGLSLSMPYVLPYGDPVGWASFPKDLPKIASFSLNRIHDSMAIFEEMESLNDKRITFGDLIGTYPRASFAITPNSAGFPETEERILNFLSEDAHMVC